MFSFYAPPWLRKAVLAAVFVRRGGASARLGLMSAHDSLLVVVMEELSARWLLSIRLHRNHPLATELLFTKAFQPSRTQIDFATASQ
ncbi:MAG: hypothetical protein WC378_06535 [Opitutaceae bacterium]